MSNLHNFTPGSLANRVQQPLTLDEIRLRAPSAFATEAHDSRSARYTYVPTVNIIEGMIKAGFQPYSATQSRTRDEGRREFTKHMIRFRDQNNMQLIVGDTVPEIVLINSHDGTSTYQLSAGFYRLVCLNGLMVAEGTCDIVRIKHTGDIIGEVIQGSNQLVNGTGKATEEIRGWSQLQLTDGETRAFAEAAHTMRFADSEGKVHTPITAEQLLRPRRFEDSGKDLWHTLNRVQENVIKGGLHGYQREGGRLGRAVTTRAVKGIDQDVKLNRALWTLAERMAELKGRA